jgi:dTDP-4-amino-4,6-dideoxygalactose transaminase
MIALRYPVPLHQQPAYAFFNTAWTPPCPVAAAACRELFCLPMHPSLTEKSIDRVVDAVRD